MGPLSVPRKAETKLRSAQSVAIMPDVPSSIAVFQGFVQGVALIALFTECTSRSAVIATNSAAGGAGVCTDGRGWAGAETGLWGDWLESD